jgi:hypothetical protein
MRMLQRHSAMADSGGKMAALQLVTMLMGGSVVWLASSQSDKTRGRSSAAVLWMRNPIAAR